MKHRVPRDRSGPRRDYLARPIGAEMHFDRLVPTTEVGSPNGHRPEIGPFRRDKFNVFRPESDSHVGAVGQQLQAENRERPRRRIAVDRQRSVAHLGFQ